MSGKVKMRCARCGKSFKSTGAKQIYCPECAVKERAARQTQKQTATPATAAPTSTPAAPKIVGPGAGILVPGATPPIVTAEVPPESGLFGAAARASDRHAERGTPGGPGAHSGIHAGDHEHSHGHAATSSGDHAGPRTTTAQSTSAAGKHAPGQQGHGTPSKHEHRHDGHTGAAQRPPREPRAQTEPRKPREPRPAPFTLTDETRERIEARYLELATPVEFDGIRTQLAQELGVPKGTIKRVVSELRARMQLPSWWELQAYHGSPADLERIRAAYLPLLPVPPVGIHKQIGENLGLDPVTVYQGIRRVRAEMRLPQYNPPETHGQQPNGQPAEEHAASTVSHAASGATPPSDGTSA